MAQGLIHQLGKAFRILRQHFGALLKGKLLGTIAAVIGHMAGGLVRKQIHMDILFQDIFQ